MITRKGNKLMRFYSACFVQVLDQDEVEEEYQMVLNSQQKNTKHTKQMTAFGNDYGDEFVDE